MESSPFIAPAAALQPVVPVRPVAPYIGGKRNLSRRLVELIGATPHSLYAEAFVGMGGVFFRRTRRPAAEIVNDISADVTNLFRLLQRHHRAFLDELKWSLSSRAEFDRLMRVAPDTLTDIERAARFLYLQRTAFGGKVVGRDWGVTYTGGARFDLTKLVPMLEDVHERLSGVQIERLPWRDFLDRYDRTGALFYLDPPYWGSEGDYGAGLFDRTDFTDLATRLASLQGRFILSINDRPEVRGLFRAYDLQPVETTYSLPGMGNARRAAELIITGPPTRK